MIPMSSRRRAVVEFPIECSLFVNEKAIYSITGMTQFYIESASATMVKRSQVSSGCNRLSILFYDSRGTHRVCLYYKNTKWLDSKAISGLAIARTMLN
jgi:hypothetical protein